MLKALAQHLLAEFYGCPAEVLDDVELVKTAMLIAVEAAGCTVVEVCLHKFRPQGVTGLLVLAESHAAVHTWPENGYAAVELFVCGDRALPAVGIERLREYLRPQRVSSRIIPRGVLDGPQREEESRPPP